MTEALNQITDQVTFLAIAAVFSLSIGFLIFYPLFKQLGIPKKKSAIFSEGVSALLFSLLFVLYKTLA